MRKECEKFCPEAEHGYVKQLLRKTLQPEEKDFWIIYINRELVFLEKSISKCYEDYFKIVITLLRSQGDKMSALLLKFSWISR